MVVTELVSHAPTPFPPFADKSALETAVVATCEFAHCRVLLAVDDDGRWLFRGTVGAVARVDLDDGHVEGRIADDRPRARVGPGAARAGAHLRHQLGGDARRRARVQQLGVEQFLLLLRAGVDDLGHEGDVLEDARLAAHPGGERVGDEAGGARAVARHVRRWRAVPRAWRSRLRARARARRQLPAAYPPATVAGTPALATTTRRAQPSRVHSARSASAATGGTSAASATAGRGRRARRGTRPAPRGRERARRATRARRRPT